MSPFYSQFSAEPRALSDPIERDVGTHKDEHDSFSKARAMRCSDDPSFGSRVVAE